MKRIFSLTLLLSLLLLLQVYGSRKPSNHVINAAPLLQTKNVWYSNRENPFVVFIEGKKNTKPLAQQNSAANQMRVTPTTYEPWSGIVSLDVEFGINHMSCTGFFVGPRIVATAGECVHDGSGWASIVRVYPGRDSANTPFNYQEADTLYAMTKWIDEQDAHLNIGAIELPDETLFQATGGVLFEHGAFTDQSLIVNLGPNLIGNLAGYPTNESVPFFDCPGEDDGFTGCQLWFDSQLISSATYSEYQSCNPWPDCEYIEKGLVGYEMDASEEGQRGAPIWLFNGFERIAVGIHTSTANNTTCSESFSGLNCGPLITNMVAQSFDAIGSSPTTYFVFGPFQAETHQPPAILLVHGWFGDCDLHFREFPDMLAQIMVDKHIVSNTSEVTPYIDCFNTGSGGYDYRQGMAENAESLSNYVESFRQQLNLHPNHRIILVGYSYGSLVTRYYLEKLGGDAYARRLLMLGPPNKGIAFLPFIERLCALLPEAIEPLCSPGLPIFDRALVDMQPLQVFFRLNNGFSQPESAYNVLIGDGANSYAPVNFFIGSPNDCLVDEYSAIGLNFPTRLVSGIDHGILPLFGCESPDYVTSGSATEFLISDSIFEGGGSFENPALTLNSQEVVDEVHTAFDTASLLAYGTVANGEANTFTIEVTEAETTTFSAFWIGVDTLSPEIRLTIESPDGTVYSGEAPGVQHSLSSGPGFGHIMFDTYSVTLPQTGDWILRVEGIDVPDQGYPYAITTLVVNSPYTFSSQLDRSTYRVGENILLTAILSENDIPLPASTVTAVITFPDESQNTLLLNDSGLKGDLIAHDGVFSASLTTQECGLHAFDIVGVASTNVGAITRSQSLHVTVNNPGGFACDGGFVYLPAVLK